MSGGGQDTMIRHGTILLAATQLANASNLLFQVVMGRTLSAEQFVVLATMLNIVLVLATPMDAVRTAMAHFASRLSGEGRAGEIRGLLGRSFAMMTWAAVPVVLAALAFGPALAAWFKLASAWPVVLTGLIVAGSFYMPVFIGALQGVQRFGWMVAAQHSWSVVRLALGWLLVAAVAPLAVWGLAGQLAGVAASVACGGLGWLAVSRGEPGDARARPAGVFRYFGFSLLILGGFAVLMNADLILVRGLFTPEAAQPFARAATIGRSVVFVSIPIALAMFPKVTSAGEVAAGSRGTLGRAFAFASLVILLAVGAVSFWPALPLRILFKVADPDAELVRLVRTVTWAMSPLGLAYLAMHFELAQHRFRPALPLLACAAAYVLAVALRHGEVGHVVQALAASSWLAVIWLLAGLPWRRRGSSALQDISPLNSVGGSSSRETAQAKDRPVPGPGRPCVFFDRDGIVNRSPGPGYVERVEDFYLLPEFVEALRVVRARGYEAVIVTNQRGVALGRMTAETVQAMHDELARRLRAEGLDLLDIRVCTANDNSHPDRKPNPGMILTAARRHGLDLSRSWMVGDHERDMEAGRRAGCRTVLVGGEGEPQPASTDFRIRDMADLPAFLEAHL
ncbi:MAG: HAD-IIIA family hydrolase [Kiritimatiellae bacterium]|nr:HAD-IIIA family hydrolase [Kiritimatiellia bacterium]